MPLQIFKVFYIIKINKIYSNSCVVLEKCYPCFFILYSIILNVYNFEKYLSCNFRLS